MPILQKISEENPELAVIGINVLETKDAIETFLWDVGVNYQVLQDAWGEVFVNYRVTKIPATFLIDERGVIVWKKFGSVSEKELENQLKGFSQRR
jgi:peroxiredoxin